MQHMPSFESVSLSATLFDEKEKEDAMTDTQKSQNYFRFLVVSLLVTVTMLFLTPWLTEKYHPAVFKELLLKFTVGGYAILTYLMIRKL